MKFIEVPVKMRLTVDEKYEDMGIDVSDKDWDETMVINVNNIDHFYSSSDKETEVYMSGVSFFVQMPFKEFKVLVYG